MTASSAPRGPAREPKPKRHAQDCMLWPYPDTWCTCHLRDGLAGEAGQ